MGFDGVSDGLNEGRGSTEPGPGCRSGPGSDAPVAGEQVN